MDRSALRLTLAVALVSAGALAYQLLLMRWLAIAHWHPFAAMIISLALLGHGASGTWIALRLARVREHFGRWFPACAVMFALTAVAALVLARAVPFNGLELVWNPRQLGWLAALYLVLATPFFFAAACFGLAFARHGGRIPALYAADLAGAGLGALAGLSLMHAPLGVAIVVAAGGGVLAAMVMAVRRAQAGVAALAGLALAIAAAVGVTSPPTNEFKGLSKALLLPGARVLAERDSPYGRLSVVDSARVPLRHQVGLSLSNTREPAPQLGVFVDGDGPAVITRRSVPAALDYLDRSLSTLPYRLQRRPRVLLLGAGGGTEIVQALRQGARSVDVAEADPHRLQLLCRDFAAYAGAPCADPRVRVHAVPPRAFVRATAQRFDVIVLASEDSLAGGSAGVQAASEQFALTVEALHDYLRVLAPQGVLAATRYRKQPPRDEFKLWAGLVAALRRAEAGDPSAHLLALTSWDASLLVAARAPLTRGQRVTADAFANEHGFERMPLSPTHPSGATTSAPFLSDDGFAQGLRALLSPDARGFVDDYRFAIAPATDDRPYFSDFFRWRSLPELWRLRDAGGAVLLDAGYLLLIAALVQAVPLAIVLVLLPLWRRGAAGPVADFPRWRLAVYFSALGLGFLMIEIACLSRLARLIGHPLPAVAVGLGGFLLFAGAGSALAPRLQQHSAGDTRRALRWAVTTIALGLLWHLAWSVLAFDASATWPMAARAVVGLAGIAPLAMAMGLPFPLGLAQLARRAPHFVPWAWGLNGCASVVAAIAALLLATAVGLRATLWVALGLYVIAAWAWPSTQSHAH